jgi:diguanylate cyclase (GGDEF)-like protein
VRFYAGIPLQSNQGHNLGTLCVIDRQPRHFSNNQVALLDDLAKLVLREFELRRLATVQPISGFPTRASFLEQAEPELARARQGDSPLALLVIELDHFSQLRQRWGQQASDQVLLDVAALLSSQQSPQDLVGQIDEQQFALLMANTDLDAALERADAIRCGINELSGVFTASGHRLGISGGLTQLALSDQGAQDLLHRAEKALILAQGNGQNQIAKLLDNAPLPAGDYPERRNRA